MKPSLEERYIAARDAAIKKFSQIDDAGALDDTAKKAKEAAFADLKVQIIAILAESRRKGFGPAKLNLETFYKDDEDFGTLDGLRFDAEFGKAERKRAATGPTASMSSPRLTSS